jgi:hypothetical protein
MLMCLSHLGTFNNNDEVEMYRIFTLLPRWGNFLNVLRDYAEK